MITKRNLFLAVIFSLSLPVESFAGCLPTGCQVLDLDVEHCEFTTISNRAHIEKMISNRSAGEREGFGRYARGHIAEEKGILVRAKVVSATPVKCYEQAPDDQNKPKLLSVGSVQKFFYQTDKPDACEAFSRDDRRVFVPATCCDTLPPEPLCVIEDLLISDLPDFLRR